MIAATGNGRVEVELKVEVEVEGVRGWGLGVSEGRATIPPSIGKIRRTRESPPAVLNASFARNRETGKPTTEN